MGEKVEVGDLVVFDQTENFGIGVVSSISKPSNIFKGITVSYIETYGLDGTIGWNSYSNVSKHYPHSWNVHPTLYVLLEKNFDKKVIKKCKKK